MLSAGIQIKSIYRLLQLIIILVALGWSSLDAYGQANGDYRTRATGNWNANNSWQVRAGGSWVNCGAGDYPGASSGAGTVNILNNHTITVTANVPNSIGALRIDGGNQDSYLQFNAGVSLTVTGQTYLNSTSNNDEKSVLVDAGIFRTGSVSANSNGDNRDAYIRISTGDVTVDGTVSLNSTNVRTYILFTDAGTLYVGGTITGGIITSANGGGASSPTSGAVVYNLAGAQNIGTYDYFNLGISGSGNKALQGNISVEGTLTLTSGSLVAGPYTLTLNGPAIAGTPANLSTTTTSSLVFGGSSSDVIIPSSVADLNNLTINNASGVTMNSNITLASGGILTLTSGLLNAGSNIIAVTNTSASAIAYTSGSFVNVTTGALQRTLPSGLTGTGNNYLFPIGEGGTYKAINLIDVNTGALEPQLRASVRPTGAQTGDDTTIGPVDPRYWSLINNNSGSFTSAAIELYESDLDLTKTIGMAPAPSGNYTAIGGTLNASSISSTSISNPGPYFCIGSIYYKTFYSYQTGSWQSPSTWTTDPSGTLQIGNEVPGGDDNVVILPDRTVTMAADVAAAGMNITVRAGGFLDMAGNQLTGTIASLSGQGTIRLATANFPSATSNSFVNSGGGTIEYYNSADFVLPASQAVYNNLVINTAGATGTQFSDITINGSFYIKSGTYRINDNASTTRRTLTVAGNVTVDSGAALSVGNGVTNTAIGGTGGTAPFLNYYLNFHTVILRGDFTNNGTVRFTNLAYPLYTAFPPTAVGPTSGAATVYFQGASDNTLTCNGTTDFYNLVVNKGTDQTYKLTINSSGYSNFRLFGANLLAAEAVTANPTLRKALWIHSGTLVMKGNIIIPSLTEGTATDAHYYIPANGALLIDGVDAVLLSTADDYREVNTAYGVSAPSSAAMGITSGGNSGLYVFGRLQINNGYLSARESAGVVTSSVASGQVIINGGTVDAKQFLSSTGTASYSQSGGLFILRGRFSRTPASYASVADLVNVTTTTLNTARVANGISSAHGSFNLENAANIFTVTGGTIRIYDVTTTGVAEAFDVKSSAANINVTGGTLEIIPTTGTALADATDYSIFSTAPVNNLSINRTGSTSAVRLSAALLVRSNLVLTSGVLNANSNNLTIGGDFFIGAGTTYTTGTNITAFNGSSAQVLTVDLASPVTFSSFTADKPSGTELLLSGTQNSINVSGLFTLVSCTLNDNGKTVSISGNVFNSGLHKGSGRIVLNGTSVQTINGNGIFENLELDNTNAAAAPVSLIAGMTLNGILTFSEDKLFNISTFNLHLTASASIAGSSSTRYIQTAGNAGDGGLSKAYSAVSQFTFPVGVPGSYTPATIGFTAAPATFGTISIIPVDYEHPVTSVKGQSLTYFWRIKSAGFTGIPLFSVTHTFVYSGSDVNGIESSYVPSVYDGTTFAWYSGLTTDINTTTNTISDWTSPTNSTNFLDADYTAGEVSSFGTPVRYYSRQSGVWSVPATWSLTGHTTDNPPAAAPGANDIVIIGGNDSIYLSNETPSFPPNNTDPLPTYYQLNKAEVNCASLQIEAGSVLDIQNNPGCTFATVLTHPNGNGKIRLTTRDAAAFDSPEPFVYPTGDFSEFSAYDGISDFYTINPQSGTYYTLPSNASDYGTVILTPLGGSNIILPNIPVVNINGDLICNGSIADAWLAMTWNGEYGAIVSKTVNVAGDLRVAGGSLVFIYNGVTLQQIIVNGDVYVSPNTAIDVWTATTNNIIQIGGNLYNNSNYGSNTSSYVRFLNGSQRCNVTFFGNNSAVVTNNPAISTTPRTVFGSVTLNKGTTPDSTLTWNIGGTLLTPADNWLTLQNGTLSYDRSGNLTVSTTTDFIIPATAGLTLNTPSNVYLSNNPTSETVYLNGRLRILNGGGNVYIGPASNTTNNADIEYSGSGASLLEIQGGNVFVNGQIRRPIATTNGVLTYRQSGGNVIIYGNNANLTKAKLEVLNEGSEFTMSGGTINIVRGGGTTFGDLYLRPAASSVTGGTIIFSQTPATGPLIDLPQTYSMDANSVLNNLTVTGKTTATAQDASVSLMVSPLVLNGTLSISNNLSTFSSNNNTVTIKGDLNNSGTYNYGTSRTVFSGGAQAVTGSSITDFYDLEVSPVTSLTVIGSFTVLRNLEIATGNLVLNTALVTLRGDITNNGAYTDDNSSGGVRMAGSTQQTISGTGSFGRLVLDNLNGATVSNDITVQNNLVLTQGILDINSHQLTLGQNSQISGGPFSASKMIRADGVASSRGLLKFFPAAGQIFTFPVGVSAKYTPAIFDITASTNVGSVRVNPVDASHPSISDPLNALGYYWQIESSGLSGFNAELTLRYLAEDVAGDESSYVAARLVLPGSSWDKATPGAATDNVNEATHTVRFLYTGSSSLNGDYTAGIDTAIPDEVPTYRTIVNGSWSDQNIWEPVGASPPCPAGGPVGSNVIINHTVTANINYISALNTQINNELRIPAGSFGHNLGNVDGDGKLYVEGGNLPAGTYTDFTSCSGNGTIEYGGTGTYIVVSGQYTSLPNLFFTGTGERIIPNTDLTVCRRLVIDGPSLDNSFNNRKITILGTMERINAGIFRSGTGIYPAATVIFAGTSQQIAGGATGDFTGTSRFNNLEINNPAGLTIAPNGVIEVNRQLLLTNGIISTTSTNRLLLLSTASDAVMPVGGQPGSFISGPLTKNIINGDSYIYPIGRGTDLGHAFTLTSTAGTTLAWTAEYFRPNPTATSIAPPLQVSNTQEYWSVSAEASATAKIKTGWDPQSELTPLMTANGIADMRVAQYIAGLWTELPSAGTGSLNTGAVETLNSISISTTPSDFTSASISGTLARAALNPAGPVCGTGGIPVSFTSFTPINLNYILSYTINGTPQPDITVTSLPYTLPAAVPGAYRLTGFRYNSGAGQGVVDASTVVVYTIPTTADAGANQSLCGVSSTLLAGNDPAPYTGLWSVISGSGGSFVNSVQYNTVFNGILGVTYTLRWTISNGPCSSYDDVVISFPVVASQPGDFTASAAIICRGTAGYVYTVPFVSGVTYAWSYSGTGHTINGTGNSVTVDFSASATSGTLGVTATNACGTSPARTIGITAPGASFSYPGSPYCQNQADPLPALAADGVAGTFTSTPGLVFVNSATGQVDLSASTSGVYTVTNTATIPLCGTVAETASITVSGQIWTGNNGTDWNNPGNWSCGFVPFQTTSVQIPDVANDPVINIGITGGVTNLIMETGSSLTVNEGVLGIAGSVTNGGSFDVTSGTVIFNGTSPQSVSLNTFSTNTVENITVNNNAGVTLLDPLNVTGVVLVQNGSLASGGNLILASDAAQTALVDGTGAGSITGSVTMQRYLPLKFGYKYFSSPFQNATVGEFGDDMDLTSPFPLFYRNEENSRGSGWVSYTASSSILNPMEGYAVNFGATANPWTVDVTGVVNNGPVSVNLYNHDSIYTQGFNLVGNPYPSPIDWNAAGWTKTAIDNAVYYFRSSETDEYGGEYSSYAAGVSSDGSATNIIPSMQGFFVHVSDGAFPVTGTLGMTNSVRVKDLTHPFLKSAHSSSRFLVRATASFTGDPASADPLVVYFNDEAEAGFDSEFDALKLMNTDMMVTNFYSVLTGGKKLSINALPVQTDSATVIPLGLKTYIDGELNFRIRDIENLPEGGRIYFRDRLTGASINLLPDQVYKVTLSAGDYNDRFSLEFLKGTTGIADPEASEKLFTAYSTNSLLKVTISRIEGRSGIITVFDLAGRPLYITEVSEAGNYEFETGIKQGIYIISYKTGMRSGNMKLFIGY
ncbi:MAG: hypothetical protein U5L72_01035 [Bacteroidales bacterium]|nr:hypothetical protein [Bacteroidales bacterium]